MAFQDRDASETESTTVQNETTTDANTANRVGLALLSLSQSTVWNYRSTYATRPDGISTPPTLVVGDRHFATDSYVLSVWDGASWIEYDTAAVLEAYADGVADAAEVDANAYTDTIVAGVFGTANPLSPNASASPGVSTTKLAREDHVHPPSSWAQALAVSNLSGNVNPGINSGQYIYYAGSLEMRTGGAGGVAVLQVSGNHMQVRAPGSPGAGEVQFFAQTTPYGSISLATQMRFNLGDGSVDVIYKPADASSGAGKTNTLKGGTTTDTNEDGGEAWVEGGDPDGSGTGGPAGVKHYDGTPALTANPDGTVDLGDPGSTQIWDTEDSDGLALAAGKKVKFRTSGNFVSIRSNSTGTLFTVEVDGVDVCTIDDEGTIRGDDWSLYTQEQSSDPSTGSTERALYPHTDGNAYIRYPSNGTVSQLGSA